MIIYLRQREIKNLRYKSLSLVSNFKFLSTKYEFLESNFQSGLNYKPRLSYQLSAVVTLIQLKTSDSSQDKQSQSVLLPF